MDEKVGHADAWLWLTVPVAILLAVAAGAGVFVGGLYRDTPALVTQARGQDAITLIAALPTLVIAALLTGRGSQRARLVWLGALVYLVYTYVGYAFSVRFNSLFLVYVALLGCSLYALIGGLVTTDWAGIKAAYTERTPMKAISIYLPIIAILFYLLWLSEAVPASLTGNPPQSLIEAGTPTNFIHVLDMARILPALLIAGVNLGRKRPLGYTLAGVLLAYLVLLSLAILSIVVYMVRAGQPVVIPQVAVFGLVFILSIGMLAGHLNNLKPARVSS